MFLILFNRMNFVPFVILVFFLSASRDRAGKKRGKDENEAKHFNGGQDLIQPSTSINSYCSSCSRNNVSSTKERQLKNRRHNPFE